MSPTLKSFGLLAVALFMAAGCATAPSSTAERSELLDDARQTIATVKRNDPSIQRFFSSSAGYAVFPNIAKGGLVLGGAYGRGVLFENGRFTSYCDVSQGTVGFQIGGQAYSELIFFENQNTLNDFKSGAMSFAAQATAVAVTAGAAANMNYANGVAIFVTDQRGLMAEASVGGQKFSVIPTSDSTFAGDPNMNREPQQGDAVYGYANDQDPGWRADSEYSRLYNANQSRTLQGEVISISEFVPAQGAKNGRQITIRASDGQTRIVHLGPIDFLDRNDNVRIRQGDWLSIKGASATFEGREVFLAREITTQDDRRLELRDSDGRTRWN